MNTSVKSFVHNENIKNFKKRLEAVTDDAQRRVLLTLLAEEKAKAEPLAKSKQPTQAPREARLNDGRCQHRMLQPLQTTSLRGCSALGQKLT
jgi:hypothetical protein